MNPPTGEQNPAPRRTAANSHEELLHSPKTALWSGVALVAIVALIAALIPAHPLTSDRRWSEWMTDIEGDAVHHLALVFNYLGRGLGRALSVAAIGLALALRGRWQALLALATTESLTPLATNLLKLVVDRPRPANAMLHPTGSSFPSGHTSYAAATAVALVLLFTRPGRVRLIWWSLAGLATAGMAWSRTYLQLHWLTDTLAGALLGIGVTLVSFAAIQLLWSRPLLRQARRFHRERQF